MIQCQSCHYQALGPNDLTGHLQAAHGFGPQDAMVEAARVMGKDNEFAARIEGNQIVANIVRGYQRQLAEAQAESAAYRAALVALMASPVVAGLTAGIRDDAKERGVSNPIDLARDALK